nr:inositol monophosphatase [Anaerolineae bacterium]
LAEERGLVNEQTAFQWLVDPLDGTNNFAHGFPVFAVSIGLQYEGEPLLGVIYDPLRDECFSAAKGTGARLNDKPIRVSSIAQLEQGLLATGFPYDRQTTEDNNSQAVAAFLRKGQGIRRAGAAALDLAYVACGRLDGYWEQRLNPWDIAAGLVIVREAGGMITPYSGKFDDAPVLRGENVVASNGLIHDAMLAVLDSVYIYTDSGMPQLK